MSELLEPYLKVENNDNICLICSKELGNDVSFISKYLKENQQYGCSMCVLALV